MSLSFANPFSNYGTIVTGDKFFGRKKELNIIYERILFPERPGNLAIIGEPRIGKSSLVYHAIMENKNKLLEKQILPIWINLSSYNDSNDFFISLVDSTVIELKQLDIFDQDFVDISNELSKNYTNHNNFNIIKQFFKLIKTKGYHILFIIDEFDHARNLFKDNITGFQKLRELSYQPEWRVNYLITSRRSISEIEQQSKAISNFQGIFKIHYLSTFNHDDMIDYYNTYNKLNILLTNEDKKNITNICGTHPYLLAMLGYEIIEIYKREKNINIDRSLCDVEESLKDYYKDIISLLSEEGNFDILLQILFGPIFTAKQIDADRFQRYGLIELNNDKIYTGYSEHFQNYLSILKRNVNIWPKWGETEQLLRKVISEKMEDAHSKDWINYLETKNQNFVKIFNNCRTSKTKEEKNFGSAASPNLIDYTYPDDLFNIIISEWTIFKSIFKKDQNYWDLRRQLLTKIRTPLAHNRPITEYEKQIAEGYLSEIISLLK